MTRRISGVIGVLWSGLMLAPSGMGQELSSAIIDASYGPHGYETWRNLTQHLDGSSELGLWLDKERYDTLDVSAGAESCATTSRPLHSGRSRAR